MSRRFPKLGRWMAIVYLAWSLLVYFGTLGTNGHQWWPLFLYYIIWPLSLAFDVASAFCLDWMFPNNPSTELWWFIDGISATFYICVGTIWVWLLGQIFSRIATRFSKALF